MQKFSKLSAFVATMSLVSLIAVSAPAVWADDTAPAAMPAPAITSIMPTQDMMDKMTEADYKAWMDKAMTTEKTARATMMDAQKTRMAVQGAWAKMQGKMASDKRAAEKKAMMEKRDADIKAMKEKKAADKKAKTDTLEQKAQKKAGELKAKSETTK